MTPTVTEDMVLTMATRFASPNPSYHEIIKAEGTVEVEDRSALTPHTSLYGILKAKGRVTFRDGSGVEYAECTGIDGKPSPYIKAIGPGGKAFAYPLDKRSIATILNGFGHLLQI